MCAKIIKVNYFHPLEGAIYSKGADISSNSEAHENS
jgi:hypothetical protein